MSVAARRTRAGGRPSAREWLGLAGFLALAFAAAAVGSAFTITGPGTWHAGLEQPAWAPPDWLFAPVWTLLYVLIAVSAWRVWRERGIAGAPLALGLWLAQLILNAAWPALFFGLRSPAAGFAGIVLLWLAIVATAAVFWRREPLAGLLLLPYLAWVTYAGALNFAIWRLNP